MRVLQPARRLAIRQAGSQPFGCRFGRHFRLRFQPRKSILRPGERREQRMIVIGLDSRFGSATKPAWGFERCLIVGFPGRLEPKSVVVLWVSRHIASESVSR